jgi:hypothetical protein
LDKHRRNAIERATQRARKLLEDDFAAQLEGDFDVHRDGAMAAKPGPHLTPRQAFQRERIVAAIEHKRAAGMKPADAARDYLRDAAFTTLNRFVALKMLEARELVQECITKGEQSAGYREFCGMAPSLPLLPDSAGYRLYIESLFDELSTEVKVLFDRRDLSSVLWPKRATSEQLLEILNGDELACVWGEDETIGWVYQFFNGQDERRQMREESPAPRNSRELAVRNQFFTPRYVVQFLTDNTLGRIWYEMRAMNTMLAERCEYMVRKPGEDFPPRPRKDPRDLRVLDPACGSGHFLLYAFDLLLTIYEEAHGDPASPASESTGRTIGEDYPSVDALRRALPRLILAHNLHGVDIDPRCAQIAQLALWMRAQKAYHEFGVARAERAQIRRLNIIVAEPLVADEQLAKEFVSMLGDVELGRVFISLVESLNRAGDMGLLSRVETFVARQAKRGETGNLFAPPEDRIRAALTRFASEERTRSSTRRRLFADDVAQGLELLRAAEKAFDVVVMNPPFGETTEAAVKGLEAQYPTAKGELAAAFVERAFEMLVPTGLVGVLMTRTPLFLTTYAGWRQDVLLKGRRFAACADLGRGVLDATVAVTASIFSPSALDARVPFFRLYEGGLVHPRADEILRQNVSQPQSGVTYSVDVRLFSSIPGSPIAYWAGARLLAPFAMFKPFQGDGRDASIGASTKDDARFLRLWYEVPAGSITRSRPDGVSDAWVAFAKGGEYAPYFRDFDLVIKWHGNGRELKAFISDYRGLRGWGYQWSAALNGHGEYFRSGVTWSRRTSTWISGRVLPPGCIFGDKGPALFAPGDSHRGLACLLAWLNSSVVSALLALSVGKEGTSGTAEASSYEVGVVERLPFPDISNDAALSDIATRLARRRVQATSFLETSTVFCGVAVASDAASTASDFLSAEVEDQRALDARVAVHYGLSEQDIADLEVSSRIRALDPQAPFDTGMIPPEATSEALASVFLGILFGRWSTAAVCGTASDRQALPDVFEALPVQPPVTRIDHEADGAVLVEDPGHSRDIASAIARMADERDLGNTSWVRDADAVRDWLRIRAFDEHLRRYSSSRRKAPIYWQLATASASYSVWLYIHACNKDSLFRVQNDYAAPKLAHEERRLESLTSELRDKSTPAQRKVLAAQQRLVEELRAFVQALKPVVPLWKPHLDDGVVVNFAPLWRLVPHHKGWQKELKATWDALCAGEFDWAHLAMHLWPERVVPKCAQDRSLAIAHGLEDVFWVEGSDGKWTPRKAPTRSVDQLVRERSSPAVKSALKNLLDAAAASGNAGRVRRRVAAAAAGDEA